jgi:hypothetical protein
VRVVNLHSASAPFCGYLAERRLALEERGLALSTTALRFAYSYGGDGETNIKVCISFG